MYFISLYHIKWAWPLDAYKFSYFRYRKSLIIKFEYFEEKVITSILRLRTIPCWIVISLAQVYREKKIHKLQYREWNTMRWIKYRWLKTIAKKSKYLGIIFHWSQFLFLITDWLLKCLQFTMPVWICQWLDWRP